MTPEPMPTRLRREAALWRGSKLAELLTQAAEQMEAAIAHGSGGAVWYEARYVEALRSQRDAEQARAEQAEAQLAASRAEGERLRGVVNAAVEYVDAVARVAPGRELYESLSALRTEVAALTPASPGGPGG